VALADGVCEEGNQGPQCILEGWVECGWPRGLWAQSQQAHVSSRDSWACVVFDVKDVWAVKGHMLHR
jgi:hypothetical protein